MPHESKRSIGYRSFLTCNDPKGVVECGTVRKSKTISSVSKDPKIEVNRKERRSLDLVLGEYADEYQTKQKNYTASKKKEVGITGGGVDISEAAQKNMDDAINSWKASRHDRETKEIMTKDLLKEAVDLQESLVMLSRLQQDMSGLTGSKDKEKHKQKVERGRGVGDAEQSAMDSIQFRSGKYDSELDRRRHSVGGMSSMMSSEDIKRVIRDSLVRYNRLNNKADVSEEEPCDMPSTSSSQSSVVQYIATSESSFSSTASKKKTKGSNLIARLMGLEDPCPKSPPLSPRRMMMVMENENKISYQNKDKKHPVFDVDLPMARNPLFVPQEELRSRQKPKSGEVLDTFKFRGLLRSKLVDHDQQKLHTDQPAGILPPKERWYYYDRAPIVIIKPIRSSSSVDNKEPVLAKYHPDTALDAKEMLRKLRARKEAILSEAARFEASDLGEKCRDVENKGACYQEGSGDSEEVLRKPENKEPDAKEKGSSSRQGIQKQPNRVLADRKKSRVQKLSPNRFKGEEKKKNATFDHAMKPKVMGSKLRKQVQGIDVMKNQSPKQRDSIATSCTVTKDRTHEISNASKVLRKNKLGDHKKVSKESAPFTIDCHGCKKDILKTDTGIEQECTLVKDITVVVADKLLKDELAMNASQIQIEDGNAEDHSSICEIKLMTAHEDSVQDRCIVNRGPICEATWSATHKGSIPPSDILSDPFVDRDKECTDDDRANKDSPCDKTTWATANNGGTISHCEEIPSSLRDREVTLSASKVESSSSSRSFEEGNIESVELGTTTKSNIGKLKLKSLLLSSPVFVTCAEDLVDLNAADEQDLIVLKSNEYGVDVGSSSSSKAILDYANEILELMSDQNSQTPLPQYQRMKIMKRCAPLDLFLERLNKGIEYLESYSKDDSVDIQATAEDWFSRFFERDMRRDNVAALVEIWDAGWKNEFSSPEVETVVGELDKLVLGGLIDEIIADLMTFR